MLGIVCPPEKADQGYTNGVELITEFSGVYNILIFQTEQLFNILTAIFNYMRPKYDTIIIQRILDILQPK